MSYQTTINNEKSSSKPAASQHKSANMTSAGVGVSIIERLLSAMDEINRKSDSITLKLAAALAEARQDAHANHRRDDKDAWQIAFARLY